MLFGKSQDGSPKQAKRQLTPTGMDYLLVTSDDHEVSCRCDLGNRWVVVNRADYRSDDDYVMFCGFSEEEEFEYDIIASEIVKETRNSVMIRLELDVDSDSEGDSEEDESNVDMFEDYMEDQNFLIPESDEESTDEESEEDSDDDYWDDPAFMPDEYQ